MQNSTNSFLEETYSKTGCFSVTFHFGKNYGAFLQSYALSQYADTQILNFIPSYIYTVDPRAKKYPCLWRPLAFYRYLKQGFTSFEEFQRLSLTSRYSSTKQILKSGYDVNVFIVGSDQVWNPHFIKEREQVYFLSFVPSSAKRISYAASLGCTQWPKEFEQKVLPWLYKFNAISVREESSVLYLTSLGIKNVVCVCDPTILYTGDFYRQEFPTSLSSKLPFVFVYKLREILPQSAIDSCDRFEVVTVDMQKKKIMISVSEWLAYIDNAQWILTDSFHCAVFCILFHKPFVVIPSHSHANNSFGVGMNERFATLLGKTGLEYRVLQGDESKESFQEKLHRPVDWKKVDCILEEWRIFSGNWLKEAIG
jgi:hypothetical protein